MVGLANGAGELTPREIVRELDRHIVGQQDAKRAVAVALRNRWRRQRVDDDLRDEIMPKNILMIGPTGVGKTEIARRLARLARAPFLKVEASKFTEVGYVGRDVESMVRDLVDISINLVRREEEKRIEARVRELVEDRLLEQLEGMIDERPPLDESGSRKTFIVGEQGVMESDASPRTARDLLLENLRRGLYDDKLVEVEVSESANPMAEVFQQPGMEDMDLGSVFGSMFPSRLRQKKMRVREAYRTLMRDEADRLLDHDLIVEEALRRAQQSGIIFLDEIDKIAGRDDRVGPDVSRGGVQRDLLPIVEGSSVSTKHGVVKTDHVLFIAAGAFHVSKPSDLVPELQGRFPIRVELQPLTQGDFTRILREPKNSLTRQYTELLRTEGIVVEFAEGAIETIAEMAFRVNASLENIGARRLHTIMERVFEDISFTAPELEQSSFVVTPEYVRERLEGVLKDEDLSRFIL